MWPFKGCLTFHSERVLLHYKQLKHRHLTCRVSQPSCFTAQHGRRTCLRLWMTVHLMLVLTPPVRSHSFYSGVFSCREYLCPLSWAGDFPSGGGGDQTRSWKRGSVTSMRFTRVCLTWVFKHKLKEEERKKSKNMISSSSTRGLHRSNRNPRTWDLTWVWFIPVKCEDPAVIRQMEVKTSEHRINRLAKLILALGFAIVSFVMEDATKLSRNESHLSVTVTGGGL